MQVYLVGGAVRERLLGRPQSDRDHVVVGATPEALLAAGYRPVGKDFPVFLHPESKEEYALYKLIWNRFVASQMRPAVYDEIIVDIAAGPYLLRAKGSTLRFKGFLAVYEETPDEKGAERPAEPALAEDGTEPEDATTQLPPLAEGDVLKLQKLDTDQHFTQPPPRYSEASLVKRLEELGIGRPSTYASILQTLKDREYVRVEKARFIPEESGRLVTAFLERFFERYVSYDYTAELEEELDDVSGGRLNWQKLLDEFWRDFRPKAGEVMEQKPSEVTAALDEFLSSHAEGRWAAEAKGWRARIDPVDKTVRGPVVLDYDG